MSFVRPQPWADDDSGLMFQTCERCGTISIQRFSADGSGAGVWLLAPEAMVLFRAGVPPAQVFDYAFSEDFARNRGITQALFRGFLRYMLDLSGAANVLVAKIGQAEEQARVDMCIEMLHDVLVDFLRRAESGDPDSRMNLVTIGPVAQLVAGNRTLKATNANASLELRTRALDILETFAQPILWSSLPPEQAAILEQTIDHMEMVEQSTERLLALADGGIDDVTVREALVEAKFFYRVFRRRKARLSKAHATAVWRLMIVLARIRDVSSPLDAASGAYEALRALLEHQIVEMGFLKLAPGERDGEPRLRFRSPNTGEVLGLPLHRPSIEIYATPEAAVPSAVLDSWGAALDRL